ncbi:transporter [Viscerimonas tarda]
MLNKIKSYMMPIAMTTGIVFYDWLSPLGFITPYLVSVMLFISYCNISLKDIRISKLHLILVSIQLAGSFLVYQALSPFSPVVAQGTMICVLAPTATSAVVITGMLGGSMSSLTTYSLLSNMCVVIFAPLAFVLTGYDGTISFWQSFFIIFGRVFLILLLPFALSLLLRRLFPAAFGAIRKKQSISFYLWSFALTVVTARTLKFVLSQDASGYQTEITIALLSLLVCVLQFLTGRKLGRRYADTVAGGQGLGQKNTVLAIWMAQTFLNPISSIGPGAYVLWQNLINSWQVWRKNRGKSSVS